MIRPEIVVQLLTEGYRNLLFVPQPQGKGGFTIYGNSKIWNGIRFEIGEINAKGEYIEMPF